MRILTPADYRAMPWKNGLGTTTELFRADAADGSMLWRVSIAGVAADGPFSAFPGYDRHIMILAGSGMELTGGPDRALSVRPEGPPVRFSGDWPISARLVQGPVRDFNLIARRSALESQLAWRDLEGTVGFGGDAALRFVHVVRGTSRINGHELPEGWSALLDNGEPASAEGRQARLCLCTVRPPARA